MTKGKKRTWYKLLSLILILTVNLSTLTFPFTGEAYENPQTVTEQTAKVNDSVYTDETVTSYTYNSDVGSGNSSGSTEPTSDSIVDNGSFLVNIPNNSAELIETDITAPTIISTDPTDGSTMVPLNKVIKVNFSENIEPASNFAETAFVSGSTVVEYTYSISNNVLSITPLSLQYNVSYSVYLPSGSIKDVSGNILDSAYSFSFTTIGENDSGGSSNTSDTVAPEVYGSDPQNGASNIPQNKTLKVFFNENVVPGENYEGISLETGNATVGRTLSLNENVLSIDPSSLDSNITYTVYMPAAAVQDVSGNPLEMSYSFSFRTADITSPVVSITSPADGSVLGKSSQTVPVTAIASDAEGIAKVEFYVDNAIVGESVYAPYTCDWAPTAGSHALTAKAYDTSGNFGISNTVSVSVDLTAPSISSTDPGNGETNIPLNKVITINFNEKIVEGPNIGGIILRAGNTGVGYTSSINNNVLSITPTALDNNVTYTVYLPPSSVKDMADNELTTSQVFSFSTPDTAAPVVNSTDPVNGAVNVPINQVIKVNFSENIMSGPTYGGIVLKTEETVVGAVYSISDNTLTITPSALDYNVNYSVYMPAGAVSDLAGNYMAEPYQFEFITALPKITVTKKVLASGSQLVLNWPLLQGYTSYNVYRATTQSSTYERISTVSVNNYTDTNLISGTTYLYKIGYVDNQGNEKVSDPVEFYYKSRTYVLGTITSDTVWDEAGGPYIINGDLTVASGVTLTLQPGVVLLLPSGSDNRKFSVLGKLNAAGSEQKKVVISSVNDPAYGGGGVSSYDRYFKGINIGSSGEFTGNYVEIKYGGSSYAPYGVTPVLANILVEGQLNFFNSVISDSYYSGIKVAGSGIINVQNSNIIRNKEEGIYVTTNGNVTIENSIINLNKRGIKIGSFGFGTLIIRGNQISGNSGYPIEISLDGLKASLGDGISSNIITGKILITSYSMSTDLTLSDIGIPYRIDNDFTISSGRTLTLEPGVVLLLPSGSDNRKFSVLGKLNAAGSEQKRVVISSVNDPAYGGGGLSGYDRYFKGINIGSSGEFTGNYVEIRYGGSSYTPYGVTPVLANILVEGQLNLFNSIISDSYNSGIKVAGSGNLNIQNCNITRNTKEGIYVTTNGNVTIENSVINLNSWGIKIGSFGFGTLIIKGNQITGNLGLPMEISLDGLQASLGKGIIGNTITGKINITSYSMSTDLTLSDVGAPYSINSEFTISNGRTLTLEPGVVLLLSSALMEDNFIVQGKLNAAGSEQKKVVISSINDPAYGGGGLNDFDRYFVGIIIESTGEFSGNYVEIKYGGSRFSPYGFTAALANILVKGQLNLFNSIISDSDTSGIKVTGNGSLNVQNSNIIRNRLEGIYLATTKQPIIISNTIIGNSSYGIYNSTPSQITINAAYNYWGSIYGPSIYDSARTKWIGYGDKVSSGVIYTPYLGYEYRIPLHFGEDGTDIATGNFSRNYTDMTVNSPGFELKVGRTYNSRDTRTDSKMGRGWTFSFEGYIEEKSYNNSVIKVIHLPNGSSVTFTVNSDDTYKANDSRHQLTKQVQPDSSFSYILTTKDQFTYVFNQQGRLVSFNDRNGNAVTIDVDSSTGKVMGITDAAGKSINVIYNSQGLIDTVTDPIGRTVRYEYENNLLVRAINPAGSVTRYGYDSDGFLNEIRDHDSNLLDSVVYIHQDEENKDKVSQITDANGNTNTYTYDNLNRKTTVTDLNGRQTFTCYDTSFYPISVRDAEGKTTVTEYFTDSYGINRFGEEKSITDRNNNKTQYTIDAVGNVTRKTNPDNSYVDFTYDDKNNLIKETDELGKKIFYIYDSDKKNLIKKAQPLNGTDEYSATADQTKFAITTYTYYTDQESQALGYKKKGLLKAINDPEGNETIYQYYPDGNEKTVTDPEQRVTTNYYNNIGWKTGTVSPDRFNTDYVYDNNGQVEKVTLHNGETIRIVYDFMGRKIKEISPNVYEAVYDSIELHQYTGDHGTRYEYYPNGKIKKLIDPEGYTASYTYDVYGNLLTETKPNGAVYKYEYDVMNRVTKVYIKDSVDAQAILLQEYIYTVLTDGKTQITKKEYLNDSDVAITIVTYDYAGRLVKQQNPDGTNTTKNYNTNGALNTEIDANGSTTYYKYDGLNRPIQTWIPFENSSGTIKYIYSATDYDKAGRKIAEKTGRDTVLLYAVPTVDKLKTTSYQYFKDAKVKSISVGGNLRKEFQYDQDGNLSREDEYTSSTSKNSVEYLNNHFGKPVEIRNHIVAQDVYGNTFGDTSNIVLITYNTYDKNGNIETQTTPDGVTTTYTYNKNNLKTSESEPGQDDFGNSVTISTQTSYNWEGKPLTITDPNGNVTSYYYNSRGLPEKEVNAKGGTTAYFYDRAGRMTAQIAPESYDPAKVLNDVNRTEYVYDLMGRVKVEQIKCIDPQTSNWTTITAKSYKYDNNGNIIKALDALGYEAGTGTTIDEKINSGYGTQYTYNLANRLLTVLDPVSKDRNLTYTQKLEYDALGRNIKETNAKGAVTTYSYDDDGNVLKVTIRKTATDTERTLQNNTYDFVGNRLTETDGNGNTTVHEYNAFNKVRKTTKPGDVSIPLNVLVYQYDTNGNLKKQWDSEDTNNLYNYDNQGRQLSHTQQKQDGSDSITLAIRYDKNGNKRFEIDGNNNATEKTYDELNRLLTVTNAVYQTTTYTYDANSSLLTATDWRGNTSTNIYDPLNRLIEKKDPHNKTIEKIEYNINGAQIKSYDALNNLTQYAYDKNNRLLTTTDPEGHITTQAYDDVGNISSKTDGRGKTTTYSYDELKRLTSVINAKNETTSYSYDLNGNMLTQIDAKGNTVTYEYNTANKPVRRIDHGGRTGIQGNYIYDPAKTETYTYYANGMLKTKTDRNGQTTTYTYDSHKRLVSERVGTISITYTYDKNGNQLTMTDSTGITIRTYDKLNRALTKTVPSIGTTKFQYDIITSVPEGYVAETTTDPKDNTTTKIYDKVGRLAYVTADNKTTTYTYYDNGAKHSVVYPDGSREEYTYYRDNLLKTLTNKKADGTIIETFSYTYDGAHNQTGKTDRKGVTTYTYDNLNRLETVTEPNSKVTSYSFDAAGNRAIETITQGGTTTTITYSYNEQNRLNGTTTTVNGATVETTVITYDNNGNQLTVTGTPYVNGAAQTLQVTINTYDLLNQLIRNVTPDGKTITNTYNGEGLRVEKDVNGIKTRYLYEFDKVILELEGSGNQKAWNVYGSNLISRKVDGQTAYYFYNGHGDVTVLMAVYGNQLASYYYDAFGNPTEVQESVYNSYRYSGYYYDTETGLYYLNARMYDPITARFLQEDTYRGDTQDPLSLNLYTYCHNEPVMYTDPDGHAELGYGKEFLKLMEHQLITGQIVIPGKKDVLVTQTDKLKEVKVVTKEKYQASGISQQIEREQRQKTVIKRKRQEKQGVNEISKDVLAKLNNTMLCHTSATVNDFSSPMFSSIPSGIQPFEPMAGFALEFNPLYSTIKNSTVTFTGYDPDAKEYVGVGERVITAGAILPVGKAVKVVDKADDILRGTGKGVEEITRVRHYTNRKGINGIEADGNIIAKDNNRVYVEPANKKPLNQVEAETKYQLKPGKGRDYVEFDVPNSQLEWVKNSRYGTPELTIKGGADELLNPNFVRRK